MNALFFKHLATQGAVGYSQAPGTMATFMMLPLVWYLSMHSLSVQWYVMLVTVLTVAAWYIVERALIYFDTSDPAEIVLDEMVGFLFVFIAVPITLPTIVIGFCLFRLSDIFKPFGIRNIEQLPGATGIMLDDIAAAALANFVLHILLYAGLLV